MSNNKTFELRGIVERSVKKDFRKRKIYSNTNKNEMNGKQAGITGRISFIDKRCEYARFARFFVGRMVRLVEGITDRKGWYQFIHDEDRKALNEAAGWSDRKKLYLLENPKFKEYER